MLGILLWVPPALAEPKLNWRGSVEADVRTITQDDFAFERLETTADAILKARISNHVSAVGNLRLIFREFSTPNTFGALTDRTRIDPYRLESDAMFVEFTDVATDGFDIRLGRQQIIWGSADRFHPTSNLNALDVEDPLLFGKVIANEMLSLRYRPELYFGDEDEPWFEEFGLEMVVVPFFKPAQLPQSAGLGFTDEGEQERRANTPLLEKLINQQQALSATGNWTFETNPMVELPERNISNVMVGARMSFTMLGMDLGFSYFNGFDDFPRGEKVESTVTSADGKNHADSALTLTYPRVQVAGFDMATSLDWLGGLGLWAEVGWTFHDDLYRIVYTGPQILINEIEKEHEKGSFVKATVGMDYSPASWLYINVQYLRGFLDEFGTDNLQNYLVAGMDIKLARDVVLIRLFNIFNLDEGSFVLFPALILKPWDGGEISMGSFLFSSSFPGSDPKRKFDSPAAGASNVFLKARASF